MNKTEFISWLEEEQKEREKGFCLPYYKKVYQNSDDYWDIFYPGVDSSDHTDINLIDEGTVILSYDVDFNNNSVKIKRFSYDEFVKAKIYDF